MAADVASLAGMQAVVNLARGRFGPIRGVIHAAGVAGAGIIQMKQADVAARVLGPKVKLIDSAHQVALKAREVLRKEELSAPGANGKPPARRFFVTDEPRHFERLSVRFLGRRIGDVSKA